MAGYIGAKVGTVTANAADIKGDISATDTTPEIVLKNTSEEDIDGGREGTVTFKGERSGGEEVTLAQIEGSHHLTNDDNRGQLVFKTNNNQLGDNVTEAKMTIDSVGDVNVTSGAPSLTITNTTHEDTDGGREGKLKFQGEQSGGELSTLAEIEASHDGTADDEKGDLIFRTNDGSDGASPTERLRIDSVGFVGINESSPSGTLHVKGTSTAHGKVIVEAGGSGGSANNNFIEFNKHDGTKLAEIEVGETVTDGGSLVFKTTPSGGSATTRMTVNHDGIVTMPNQPSFLVQKSTHQNNIAINSTVTITWDTERFDIGGNFASNTFTAPVTGKYQFNVDLRLDNVDTAATYYHIYVIASNRNVFTIMDPNFSSDLSYHSMSKSVVMDMDANDTVVIKLYQANGTSQTDINLDSNFSGFLIG